MYLIGGELAVGSGPGYSCCFVWHRNHAKLPLMHHQLYYGDVDRYMNVSRIGGLTHSRAIDIYEY